MVPARVDRAWSQVSSADGQAAPHSTASLAAEVGQQPGVSNSALL